MPLLSDLRTGGGGHYLYDLLDAPGAGSASGEGASATSSASDATVFTGTAGNASGAGVTDNASASNATALGWAVVTVVLPVYNGIGSIFYGYGEPWGNFEGTPQDGDTIRHETTNGFRIAPDGTIEAGAQGTYTYFYDDGTGEVERTVIVDDSIQVFAGGATATASASGASLYGGVNISGDAPDVTTAASTGSAAAGNIATGAGSTATVSTPGASIQAGAAASGEGSTVTTEASTGVGETSVSAEGAGVEVASIAADGSASGDVIAVGAGVTNVASAAAGVAVGDRRPGSIPYICMTVIYPRDVLIARAAA